MHNAVCKRKQLDPSVYNDECVYVYIGRERHGLLESDSHRRITRRDVPLAVGGISRNYNQRSAVVHFSDFVLLRRFPSLRHRNGQTRIEDPVEERKTVVARALHRRELLDRYVVLHREE